MHVFSFNVNLSHGDNVNVCAQAIKLYDVVAFDMTAMMRLEYVPGPIACVRGPAWCVLWYIYMSPCLLVASMV